MNHLAPAPLESQQNGLRKASRRSWPERHVREPGRLLPKIPGQPVSAETDRRFLVREIAPGYERNDTLSTRADVQEGLEELEEKIIVLAAHIHAATHRLLTLIAAFDRRGGWKAGGHLDCADWLHVATGIQRSTAREKVRVARALERLPLVAKAMSRGELSFSRVRAITRVVDDIAPPSIGEAGAEADAADGVAPDAPGAEDTEVRIDVRADLEVSEGADQAPTPEAEILEYARKCTTAELEKLVRSWKLTSRGDEQEQERRRHASRHFSIAPDGDGMYMIRGRVDPEVGAMLMRAVEAAGDALFRAGEDWAPEGGRRGPRTRNISSRQRRADALGLLAERALAAGFGGAAPEQAERAEQAAEDEGEEGEAMQAGEGGDGEGTPSALSGTRAERYQVVIHVDEQTLRGENEEGCSHLEDGMRVSAETVRRFACDGSTITAVRDGNGVVLDVGRKTRTIPPALRRALEIRDGGCRFPGCGLRFTDAHHIIHWARGGETKLSNLVLLCRSHHRAIHEEGFRVRMGRDGRPRFSDRTGWPLPSSAPPARLGPDPVERLVEENQRQGTDPDWRTPSASYERAGDVPWELEARAREALEARPRGMLQARPR